MKTIEEIYTQMMDDYAARTGMQGAGSPDLAARLYAVAAQVYSLQVQGEWVARQTFPQTAQGDSLDHHAQLRGLERKGAAQAQGVVRFTAQPADQERPIPLGTLCMTPGLVSFATTREGAIPPGESWVELPVQALEGGAGGNVPAGAITVMGVAPVGVDSCANPHPTTGGSDREEDEALRARILDTYRRLPNGANAAFYQQQALSFPQVAACQVLPRSRGVGTVDVVVASMGGQPEEGLVEELQEFFQSRREIAVDVLVKAPEEVPLDLTLALSPAPGHTFDQVKARVEELLRGWFTGLRLGQPVLLAQLSALVFGCEGVGNCQVALPARDVDIQPHQLPVVDRLTVEVLT